MYVCMYVFMYVQYIQSIVYILYTLVNSSLISLISSHCSERISAGRTCASIGSVDRSAAAECAAIAERIDPTRDLSGNPIAFPSPLPLASPPMAGETAGIFNIEHILFYIQGTFRKRIALLGTQYTLQYIMNKDDIETIITK